MLCVEPEVVLDALKLLTTPSRKSDKPDDTADKDVWTTEKGLDDTGDESYNVLEFDHLLMRNLNIFDEKVRLQDSLRAVWKESESESRSFITSEENPRWRLAVYCVRLMNILSHSLQERGQKPSEVKSDNPQSKKHPPLASDVLSVAQQKTVLTAIQFIVCLGIGPCLHLGVGIPMELRSELGKVIAISTHSSLSPEEKQFRLLYCVKSLLTCIKVSSIGALVLSRHLTDILACLLQLCYCHPQKSEQKGGTCNSQPSLLPVLTPEESLTPASVVDAVRARSKKYANFKCFHQSDSLRTSGNGENEDKTKTMIHGTAECHLVQGGGQLGRGSETSDRTISQDPRGNTQQAHSHTAGTGVESVTEADREWCRESLIRLSDRVYQPSLVRELLLLQGGPSPQMIQKLHQQSASRSVNSKPKPPLLGPAPPWLRRGCGRLLTQVLLKPHGVQHVLRGMLDLPAGDTVPGDLDWRKCEAVARVISRCPKQVSSVEVYYRQICPQVLGLLHSDDKQTSRQFARVGVSIINMMSSQNPQLAQTYLFQPLTEPLSRCLSAQVSLGGQVIANEAEISQCVQDLHKVIVSNLESPPGLWISVVPLLHPLFKLFCFLKQGVSHLRSAVQEILVTVARSQELLAGVAALDLFLFDEGMDEEGGRLMSAGVRFAAGPTGGVILVRADTGCPNSSAGTTDKVRVACMVDLLTAFTHEDGLTGEYFLKLLKELTTIIKEESGADLSREWLKGENSAHRQVLTLSLLAEMCERIGPSCLKSAQRILEFVKATLERGLEVCRLTTENRTTLFETETITMAMGLLTAILTGAVEVTDKDREKMAELCPLLQKLEEEHPDTNVTEMSSDLRIAIATHGAVWSARLSDDKKNFMKPKPSPTKKVPQDKSKAKIEVLSESSLHGDGATREENQTPPSNPGEKSSHQTKPTENVSPLSRAFEELCDPLIPVRGHGLITLRSLLDKRDPEALAKQDAVLTIFQENLSHSDSYLYLAAVNGLVTMAALQPDTVIQSLTQQFANFNQSEKSWPVELRLKVGECLVRASRNLGDILPKYGDVLLAAMLTGVRDTAAEVRASSLSNLGEVCKLLRFSLGRNIHEVFACCSSLLKSDLDSEVRKAAGLVLTMLLQGLGKDVMLVLEDVLRDLYRLLKLCKTVEKDLGVLVHVDLALSELDQIMRDYLFPKQTLTKKILVSRPE